MRLVVNNPNNLKKEDIDKNISKVRAIVIYNLDVYIVNYNNILMFPGGKIRDNEIASDALKREIIEELGIEISDEDIIPFMRYDDYLYKYPSRKGMIQNKLVNNYYYVVNVKNDYRKKTTSLSDKEKNSYFEILKIQYEDIDNYISSFKSSNEAFPFYQKELINVLIELKKDFDIDRKNKRLYKKNI